MRPANKVSLARRRTGQPRPRRAATQPAPLVKSFEFSELLARVQALLRRANRHKRTTILIADLEIDTIAKRVARAGVRIDLSARA